MPLVLYLGTDADVDSETLSDALNMIESFILRRDICGLPTGNYNRLFVSAVERLRRADGAPVEELERYLSSGKIDTSRWPADEEWKRDWLGRDQYKSSRQPRLRYIFEAIEKAKRSVLSEEIEIKSELTVEHIMPKSWRQHWPVPGFDHLQSESLDFAKMTRESERDQFINNLGNLTLLTSSLNTSASNAPFEVKMPKLRAHASLALNRELDRYDHWDENMITHRGAALFEVAQRIWRAPVSAEVAEAA